jgi:anaerobic selenocysteine-containing dehydrogenase
MVTQQMHTYCAMCKSRCGVLATVEDGRLTKVTADPEHPNGCICVKGTAAPEIVYSPDRLQYPMLRTCPKGERDPGWVRISWDEAMALTASRLVDLKARYRPEAVVFGCATGAGTSSADFFPWVQRLANAFGSPNILYPDHLCSWHKKGSAQYTYGLSMPQPDYEHARCMLLWGYNPQASQPTDAMRISRAKARGVPLIVIDPHKAGVVDKADLWLRVRPGSDGALALAMIDVLLEEALYDTAFVRAWTNGPFLVREDTQQLLTERDITPAGHSETFFAWDSRRAAPVAYRPDRGYAQDSVDPALAGTYACTLADGTTVACRPVLALLQELAAQYAPERSEALTWVPAADVRRAVRLFATEQPSCYAIGVGLEEHANATQTNRAVALFYALTGQFDRCGSNVLFASTATNSLAGRGLLPKEQVSRTLAYAERPLGPPGTAGQVTAYDVYRAVLTAQPYPVKGLVTFGTDLLMGNGDPLRGKAALEALDFYVHVDLFANPSASLADLLLPAASCWEREALRPSLGTGVETATWAQFREVVVQPLHESRSEVSIIFDLATRLGLGEHFFNGNIETAYDYELAPSGLTVQQLRQHPIGMRARGETRYQKYAEIDAATGQPRGFPTRTRKVEIYATSFARAGYAPLPVYQEPAGSPHSHPDMDQEYPLVLTFFRLVQYCDVQHRNIPRLRRQVPEPFLEIHPATASSISVQDGEWVILETATGRIRLKTRFKDSLHPGVVATAHGWWQGCRELGLPGYDPFGPQGANANLLVSNDVIDPISGSVPHRSQRCRIRKERGPDSEAWPHLSRS